MRSLPLILVTALFLGCSVQEPPTEELAQARLAVETALRSDAPQYAANELRLANDKLHRAERAMDEGQYTQAKRLSEQAVVDANVAQATARRNKTEQIAGAPLKNY